MSGEWRPRGDTVTDPERMLRLVGVLERAGRSAGEAGGCVLTSTRSVE